MITKKTQQNSTRTTIFFLIFLLLGSGATAAPNDRTDGLTHKKCPFVGIKASRQYLSKNDYQCYQKASQFSYQRLKKGQIKNSRQSDKSPDGIPSTCRYITIPKISSYYEKNKLRCFSSLKNVRKAKYRALLFPKPTPTNSPNSGITAGMLAPTPTAISISSTPNPLEDKGLINYSFSLSPVVEGSGYSGNCRATLNNSHTQFEFSCSHNILAATEAHIHIVPSNSKFCQIEANTSIMTTKCDLTAEQSAGIEAGLGIIAIHIGEGAESQVASGFIRNQT